MRGYNFRVRYLYLKDGVRVQIDTFPNFHKTGSIRGMKDKYYGKDSLLVQCGNYIYNVSSMPTIYYMSH